MRMTQGAFSVPARPHRRADPRADRVLSQNGWAVSMEYTDDPHPRNTYWEMWGSPMFDLKDAAGVMAEVTGCRATIPNCYVKVNALQTPTRGWESLRLSFIMNRPNEGARLRTRRARSGRKPGGRDIRYTTRSYAAAQSGRRALPKERRP